MLGSSKALQKLKSIYLTTMTFSGDISEKMPCYPFHGRSKYLIDKFYIIGYNYLTLEKTLIKNTPKAIEEDNEKDIKETGKRFFEFDEEPTILNEIANDYCKETLDTKTILQMIFPHKLKCYYPNQ